MVGRRVSGKRARGRSGATGEEEGGEALDGDGAVACGVVVVGGGSEATRGVAGALRGRSGSRGGGEDGAVGRRRRDPPDPVGAGWRRRGSGEESGGVGGG